MGMVPCGKALHTQLGGRPLCQPPGMSWSKINTNLQGNPSRHGRWPSLKEISPTLPLWDSPGQKIFLGISLVASPQGTLRDNSGFSWLFPREMAASPSEQSSGVLGHWFFYERSKGQGVGQSWWQLRLDLIEDAIEVLFHSSGPTGAHLQLQPISLVS